MRKRTIKDAPLAITFGPGKRVVAIPWHCVSGNACRIETQKYIDLVARECFRLIELVGVLKLGRQMPDDRKGRFFVDYFGWSCVCVPLILSSKHLPELWPGFKSGQACVSRHKAVPVSHECQQFFFLLGGDVNLTMAQEE